MGHESLEYIKEAVSNCEKHLKLNYDNKHVLSTQAANPFVMCYEPELDKPPALEHALTLYYQSIIGVMQGMGKI